MRFIQPIFASIFTCWLVSCGTVEITEEMLNAGIKLTPARIYEFEAEYYPNSSWSYLGRRDGSHLFRHTAISSAGKPVFSASPWVLKNSNCDGVRGFPFDPDSDESRSADVEIHKDFIQIDIDGEEPVRIPFKSKGFITSEHRSNHRTEQGGDLKPDDAPS